MTNRYTSVDLSQYYKEWDNQRYLGNKVRYVFCDENQKRIVFLFAIYNHGLAIQWIQDLFLDIQKSSLKTSYSATDNLIKNIGFENPSENICAAQMSRCFDNREYAGTFLKMQCDVFKKEKNIYQVAGQMRTSTNVSIQLAKEGERIEDFWDGHHLDITVNYNKRKQDRGLLEDLNNEEYEKLHFGQVYLGALESVEFQGKKFFAHDDRPSFSLSNLSLESIKIGAFSSEPAGHD